MAEERRRLILFTRFPEAGKVKTRLISALGEQGAAALHRRLVLRSLRTAQVVCQSKGYELEIRFTGDKTDHVQHWLGDMWLFRPQCGGDLGQRMADAFANSSREGSVATVLIGSDCPTLSPEILDTAFESLKTKSVVFGPASDGGYYLVGMTKFLPEVFQGISWGTEKVLTQSMDLVTNNGSIPALIQTLDDLDRPDELASWKRLTESEESDLSRISVIMPTLNESSHITASIKSVYRGSPHEVIVVDGGSLDGTSRIATECGARLIHSKPARARQMNAGAAQATGNVLLFLHADTLLPSNWTQEVIDTLKIAGTAAGAFGFRVDQDFTCRRLVEWATNFRSRRFQNPYGDQALFLRRSTFEELGGFSDLPIMEDYELNQRLRRLGRVATTESVALTSGRRWKRLGVVKTTLTNAMVIAGFRLGISPFKLARFYRGGPA